MREYICVYIYMNIYLYIYLHFSDNILKSKVI